MTQAPITAGLQAEQPEQAEAKTAGPVRTARRRRLLVVVGLAAVVLAGALAAVATTGSAPPVRLAAFALPRLGPNGSDSADPVRYPLSGADRGRPVVLAFFASWCVLCRTDLPVVAKVAAAEHRSGDRAVFVGIDGNDPPADGWKFAQSAGVNFPVASDQQEAVARQIGLLGLPDTVLISPSGRVVRRMSGVVSARQLEEAVAQLAPSHAVAPGSRLPR